MAEIIDLFRGGSDIARITDIVTFRCTNQREITLVRNCEDDALVSILEDVAAVVDIELGNDNVRALHQPNTRGCVASLGGGENLANPRPCRIDKNLARTVSELRLSDGRRW